VPEESKVADSNAQIKIGELFRAPEVLHGGAIGCDVEMSCILNDIEGRPFVGMTTPPRRQELYLRHDGEHERWLHFGHLRDFIKQLEQLVL
jgi:hypothetical protein